MNRTLLIGFSVALVIIIGIVVVWYLPTNYLGTRVFAPPDAVSIVDPVPEDTADDTVVPLANTLSCGSSHHGHEGELEPEYDAANTVTGWRCSFGAHDYCTAGVDGQWTECTYPPTADRPWPEPIPASVLNNPPPAAAYRHN